MNNYTVTNSNDSGEGSLREAIRLANESLGLDTINIEVDTVNLETEIEITDSLDVIGNGATIAQTGTEQGIFFITDGNEDTFLDNSFVDLTLTGGNSIFEGGAISTTENLVVDNVYFLNNSGTGRGGALHTAFGVTSVTNSTFEGNEVITNEEGDGFGAALYSELGAKMNISNSLFINNKGDKGTIGSSQTVLTITDSEIRDNQARGIDSRDSRLIINNVLSDNNQGQGIVTMSTNAEITAATVTNNTADYGSGIGLFSFDISIADSLIKNNTATISGGGISIGRGDLELTNSIVSGNTAPEGAALEAYDRATILVTDTYITNNVGESEFLGIEDITFAGTNANNQSGVLPDGVIGYRAVSTIGYQEPVEEPVIEDPITEEPPVIDEPTIDEPVDEPVTKEPTIEEPVTENPVTEEPVEEPVTEDPITEEPVDEPIAEEPVMEDPIIEDPVEEPTVDEPVTEEPVDEKPAIDEPVEEPIDEPVLQTLEITRSFQADSGVHMFTTGDESVDGVEEQSFTLLSSDVDELTGETIEGVETIYQFLNSDTDAYLFTMDNNEVDYILENLDNYSLVDELYGFESEPQDIETIPIYRLLNTDSGTHMYVEGDELGTIQSEFDNFELEVKGEAAFYALDM